MVTRRHVLGLLGGAWHDFEAFGTWLRPLVDRVGGALRLSFDTAELTRLADHEIDVVLLYNCIEHATNPSYSEDQIGAMRDWLTRGGRLLAVHSATVAAHTWSSLRALLGGTFIDHPPLGALEVRGVDGEHPMVVGIPPFRVHDELYRHVLEPGVRVHWVASNGQEEHPVAWSWQLEQGLVAYLGLGHDERAWQHEAFGRIVEQSLQWLLGSA